jgi:hypothetical protein
MKNGATAASRHVSMPSKKKMFLQVWIGVDETPHRGMRAKAVANKPPNAPAIDAAEMKIPIRKYNSRRL